MQYSAWTQAFSELVDAIVAGFVRFWKQDIIQVGLSIGMFFALAIPLLIVILVLWYIDSTGWRPASGFYKIGLSGESLALELNAIFIGLRALSPRSDQADPR